MGTLRGPGIADALFTPVQQRVLALLFGQPGRSFQSAELIRLANSGTGAVHRQLARLEGAGLLDVTRIGNQKHYRASRKSPIYEELHSLVLKTVAVVEPLKTALVAISPAIRAAFVYGSAAKGTDKTASDIDLMVVSDSLAYPDIYRALQKVELQLARSVNPTVITSADWKRKHSRHDSFVRRIAAQPRLFIIGTADDIP